MPFLSSFANFMSGIFASLFKGKTSNDSRQETTDKVGSSGGKNSNGSSRESTKEAGFQKAMTGGLLTKATVLKNETKQTLYLRDKVGSAYGTTRYQIPAHSSMHVTPLQHTFFKMLAYAVEEDKERSDEEAGQSQGSKPRTKTSTDTNLTIDSDQLDDNSEIRIIFTHGRYELRFTARP